MGDIEKFPSKSVEKRLDIQKAIDKDREEQDADAVEHLLGGLGAVALVDRLLKPSDDH